MCNRLELLEEKDLLLLCVVDLEEDEVRQLFTLLLDERLTLEGIQLARDGAEPRLIVQNCQLLAEDAA